jgi:large subunit ribosomal protein L5
MADTKIAPVTKPKAKTTPAVATTTRLKQAYVAQYAAELKKELSLANAHQVPKLEKITLNVGLGKAKDDKKMIEAARNTITKITGQHPVDTLAKNSIATFKLREGNMIGLKVTLRGERMYEFLDRFITVVLPRLRDFHGVSNKAFDRQGNFAIGLTDQSVFPELSFEETTTAHGLQAVMTIRCQEPAHAKALLEKFGMPFQKENK